MKPVKMLVLAALLALAGVAVVVVVGIGSASAEEGTGDPEIVLCEEAVALCPGTKTWPGGKGITATNEAVVRLLSANTVECKVSKMVGEAVEEMAAQITYKVTAKEFKECGREGCNALTVRFENLASGKFSVATGDKYSLKFTKPRIAIQCEEKTPCVYVSENETAALPIDNPTGTGFPQALASEIKMKLVEGEPCEATIKWDATYKLTGGALLILLSLFKL
jgi:hypothetical protein